MSQQPNEKYKPEQKERGPGSRAAAYGKIRFETGRHPLRDIGNDGRIYGIG